MAEEIRGLTVKFDADFSEFKKGMKDADKDISSTQKQLKSLSDSLKLKFDEEKFSQAQKVAQTSLEATEKKADLLKQRLAEMEKVGVTDKTRDEYNYLQEQLSKTETNAERLKNQLQELNNMKFNNLVAGIDKIGKGITQVGIGLTPVSALAGGVATGLYKIGTNAISAGANIDDLAQRAEVSAEKIQELQYVATQTGIATNTLTRALIKSRAAYADMGTGQVNNQVKALQALGIEYGQFENQEQVFDGIIERLSKMEDSTLQVAYVNEIFGDRIANELIPLLRAGDGALQQFKDEFAGFESLSNEQVTALATMDDILFRVKESYKNLSYQIGASLIPIFTYFADVLEQRIQPKVQQITDWFKSLNLEQQKLAVVILAVITALAPLLIIIGKTASGISNIIKLIKTLGIAVNSSLGWVALIIALLAVAYAKNEEFRNSLNNLIKTLMGSLSPVLRTIGQILNMIAPLLDIMGNTIAELLIPVIQVLIPFVEFLNMQLELMYDILEPILDLVEEIIKGISYIFSGGKKTTDYEVDVKYKNGNQEGQYNTNEYPSFNMPEYNIPSSTTTPSTVTDNTYYDNSTITINIEKNDYMSEEDIIKAVNKGLKQAKQARS